MMSEEEIKNKLIEEYLKKHNIVRTETVSRSEHQNFIKSEYWKNLTERYKNIIGQQCELCFSNDSLCVHHNNYWNKGKETSEDIIILCRKCHNKFHKNVKHFNDYIKLLRINDKICVQQKQKIDINDEELKEFLINNDYNDRCCLCSTSENNRAKLISVGGALSNKQTAGILRKLSICGVCYLEFHDTLSRSVIDDVTTKVDFYSQVTKKPQKIKNTKIEPLEKTKREEATIGISLRKCISCKEYKHINTFFKYENNRSEYCSNCEEAFLEFKKLQKTKKKKTPIRR